MNKFKMFFLFIFIQTFGCSAENFNEQEGVADSTIAELHNMVEVFDLASDDGNKSVLQKLSQSIVEKLLIVRVLEPNIVNLKSQSLTTLCIVTQTPSYIVNSGDAEVEEIIHAYLADMKSILLREIRKRQEILNIKIGGCWVYPES